MFNARSGGQSGLIIELLSGVDRIPFVVNRGNSGRWPVLDRGPFPAQNGRARDEGNMTNSSLSRVVVLFQQLDFVIPTAPCYPAVVQDK
jgi:hypothetical protein